jgi:hypothetical protein
VLREYGFVTGSFEALCSGEIDSLRNDYTDAVTETVIYLLTYSMQQSPS